MGLSEQIIQNKIQEISNSYLSFTGKNEVWKSGITLEEYQSLRIQAINELERGISSEKTEQPQSKGCGREAEKIIGKDTENVSADQSKPVEKEKNDNIVDYQSHIPVAKQTDTENSVMEKFSKLKDL